jgi:hypothetical protein
MYHCHVLEAIVSNDIQKFHHTYLLHHVDNYMLVHLAAYYSRKHMYETMGWTSTALSPICTLPMAYIDKAVAILCH